MKQSFAHRESLELAGVCVIGRPDHCLDQPLAHDIQVLFGDPLVHHRVVAFLLRRGFQQKGKLITLFMPSNIFFFQIQLNFSSFSASLP